MAPLLEVAERIEHVTADPEYFAVHQTPPVLAIWLQREVHLAAVRHAELLQLGVPEETAQFLAMDDPGYQLARMAADFLDTRIPG